MATATRPSWISTPSKSKFTHLDSFNEAEGCSIAMMVLLSGPRLALQMAWAAQWAALGPYLQNLLPKYAVNLTQFIGPVTGILVAPTVGVLSDLCTSPYGRRRPFLVFGAITSVICWTLMGFTRDFGEAMGDHGSNRTWTAVFTIFFYLWMDITVNIVQTPAQLIIADFVGERQTTGSAISQAASTLGALLVAAYIQIFGPTANSLHEFLALLSVVMIVTVGAVCVFAKEKPLPKPLEPVPMCKHVKHAFRSIVTGVRTLPQQLAIFALIFFCVQYGFTAYNGAKGQFFGLVVFDGDSELADVCGKNCTEAQTAYNDGVRLAGGTTDLIFNSFGYIYSWALPWFVSKFGMKYVLTVALIPQIFLMLMAFWHQVTVDVLIVVATGITQNTVFGVFVPIIIYVIGSPDDERLGLYVGALNSANCAGQFLNFLLASVLVTTSMGYALPIFVGGFMSLVGAFISVFFFKIHSKSI